MSTMNKNKLENSTFEFMPNGDLKIDTAIIFWPNFAGNPTPFNPKGGRRTFCVVLTPEIGEKLRNDGWNIKERPPREEGDMPFVYTEIVINMDSKYPPDAYLRSEFMGRPSMIKLNKETIGRLDDIHIASADVVIHPYEHGVGQFKTKGYARYINVLQSVTNYFGDKYAEYMTNDEDDEIPF